MGTGAPPGWSPWLRYTLSAAAGAAAMLVAITVAFADVRHTAGAANARSIANDVKIDDQIVPRLGALESQQAADKVWKDAVKEQLDRIERKVGR